MGQLTVYPKKYAHGFCFAVLCCGYTLTDFPISMRLTSLALWQSNDCPSASKATLMNMDKYFMWIHYERLHNHNRAKHNKTVCIFLGVYCRCIWQLLTKYRAIRKQYLQQWVIPATGKWLITVMLRSLNDVYSNFDTMCNWHKSWRCTATKIWSVSSRHIRISQQTMMEAFWYRFNF